MKFENTHVYNFEGALKGMRNPKNSWYKSDSDFAIADIDYYEGSSYVADFWVQENHPELNWPEQFSDEGCNICELYIDKLLNEGTLSFNEKTHCADFAMIGPKDLHLAQSLIKAGSEHCKFLRQIFVSVDITAPIYWWKEMSTYKIGTTTNSTSTMHTLTNDPITLQSFEIDDLSSHLIYYSVPNPNDPTRTLAENDIGMFADFLIEQLEFLRQKYIETKDKKYWKELVRWLPTSWLQTRTWTGNYEILRNICHQRKNHKLTEWNKFIHWAEGLPYASYFILNNEEIPFQIEK